MEEIKLDYTEKARSSHSEAFEGIYRDVTFHKQYGVLEHMIVGDIVAMRGSTELGRVSFDIEDGKLLVGSRRFALHVWRGYRNRGVGTRLLEVALEYAAEVAGKEGVTLSTAEALIREDNDISRKVFEKQGFTLQRRSSRTVVPYAKDLSKA